MIELKNDLEEFGTKPANQPSQSVKEALLAEMAMDPGTSIEAYIPSDPDDAGLDNKTRISEFEKRVSQWTEVARGLYISSPETIPTIAPGVYKYVRYSNDRFAFQRQSINVDELLVMPDSLSDQILTEIQSFLNKADKYLHYNFLHRRGYMFYGPAGSGKSSLVQQILKKIIDQGGIVLLCENPHLLEAGLVDLRRVEKDRLIVCLFEDIEALIARWGEKEILAVLDGESQINKVLNVATTNYPESLDKRIVGRPRRFDRVIKIDWPSAATRKHFFKHKLKIEDAELDKWVAATDKFSFAACAELVISVKCLDKPFNEALDTLKALMGNKKPSSDEYTTTEFVGFQ